MLKEAVRKAFFKAQSFKNEVLLMNILKFVRKAFFKAQSFKNEVLLMNILKFIFHYEYRNKKEHLEADYPAYRIDCYSYCNYTWSYELHDVR